MKLPCFTPTSWHAAICLGRQLPLKGWHPGSCCKMWASDFPILTWRSWWQESGQPEDNNSRRGYWGEGVIKVLCCQSGTAWIPPTWDPSRKCPAPAVDNLMLWESPTSDCGLSSSTWWSLGSTSNGKWERKGNSAQWNNPPCLQSLTKGTWEYRLHLVHCRSLAFLFWVWMAPETGLWC